MRMLHKLLTFRAQIMNVFNVYVPFLCQNNESMSQ